MGFLFVKESILPETYLFTASYKFFLIFNFEFEIRRSTISSVSRKFIVKSLTIRKIFHRYFTFQHN